MLKKIISIMIIMTMCTVLFTQVGAISNNTQVEPQIDVICLSADISEKTINEITNSVEAGVRDKNGTITPLDSVITIEKTPNTSSNAEVSYAVSATTKIVSKSASRNSGNVNASITLNLTWTDGPGTENYITKVSGSRTVIEGSVMSASVRYGNGWVSAIRWTRKDVSNSSAFSFLPNMQAADPTADYSVIFEDDLLNLYVLVSANIFQ